jgi:hypothetical protein
MTKEQNSAEAEPTVRVQITLSNHDIANLIAFGNRAQMNGQEADTWVYLKHNLVAALESADKAGDPGIVIPEPLPLPKNVRQKG